MNNYVITEIDDAQKKMSAYVTLLSYRYMNLCVKAELGALMPVNVYIGDDSYNIEDVANIYSPDDFQFAVYPKNENNQQAIIHCRMPSRDSMRNVVAALMPFMQNSRPVCWRT